MFYKGFFITGMIVSLIGCLEAQETTKTYPLTHIVDDPLSSENITQAFGQLGLVIDRYKYEFPQRHRLSSSLAIYKEGKLTISPRGGSIFLKGGENHFSLFMIRNDTELRFSIQSETSASSVGSSIPLDNTPAIVWNPFALSELEVGKKIPIFVVAADRNSVSGIGKDESPENIQRYVEKFSLAVVVYVEIQE